VENMVKTWLWVVEYTKVETNSLWRTLLVTPQNSVIDYGQSPWHNSMFGGRLQIRFRNFGRALTGTFPLRFLPACDDQSAEVHKGLIISTISVTRGSTWGGRAKGSSSTANYTSYFRAMKIVDLFAFLNSFCNKPLCALTETHNKEKSSLKPNSTAEKSSFTVVLNFCGG
jgi:hypothetical protein